MMTQRVRLRAAQALAAAWRLNGLRLAALTFVDTRPGEIVERSLFGSTMPLDVGRTPIHQMLYLEGERFIAERFLLRSYLEAGMSVIDVGANIGYYVLLFEQMVGPSGHIICIEPEPDNLTDLRRVVARNDFRNVEVVPAAAGSAAGTVHLARGINGMVADHGTTTVSLIRIDDVAPRGADFLKIDVEGYEGEVLAGAEAVLARRPRLFLEIHPGMIGLPHTVESIYATLVRHYGEQVAFYETPALPAVDKLCVQYLRADAARRVDPNTILAACRSRSREAPFWAVCH